MEKMNLKRLAKELNLSISTISKALRDSYEISLATKELVLQKARELNYQPNPHASSLRRQKSKTIAVVLPEIANNFFSLAINGIETVAQERDYHVLIYITHEDYEKEKSIIRHLQGGRVGGVIMSLSQGTVDHVHLNELIAQNIPIVFFDRICHEIETAKVTTDDFLAGFRATEHLIQNGCRQIAFLSISSHLSIDNKRMQGYLEALEKHNLAQHPPLVIQCGNDEHENHKKLRKLLSGKKKPDGIFASVEKLAVNTYEVCEEMGIRIPEDLKVLCFSNMATAHLMYPPLTAVRQPAFAMGEQAARILFRHLDKNRTFITNENVVIRSELIVRGSTLSTTRGRKPADKKRKGKNPS